MDKDLRAGRQGFQRRAQRRGDVVTGGLGCRFTEPRRPPPVEQRVDRRGGHRRRIPQGQSVRRRRPLHRHQRIDSRIQQGAGRVAPVQQQRYQIVAEVFL
jgi:hypothetical protein